MKLVARPCATRCPFCHDVVADGGDVCRGCGARAHAACALELGRCGACGSLALGDWEPRAVDGVGPIARVRVLRGDAAPTPLSLRLDLLRRRIALDGALAGQVTLSVPPAVTLGALDLRLVGPRRWLLGRRARRSLRLLGPDAPDRWAAGVYRVAFSLPHAALPGPGRVRVMALLGRTGGALEAALEARVEAQGPACSSRTNSVSS